MNSRVKYWLRWILALPGAIAIAYFAYGFVHLSLAGNIDSDLDKEYWMAVVHFSCYAISMPVFIMALSAIAPPPYSNAGALLGTGLSVLSIMVYAGIFIYGGKLLEVDNISRLLGAVSGIVGGSISFFSYLKSQKESKLQYEKRLAIKLDSEVKPAPNKLPAATLEAMRTLYGSPEMSEEHALILIRRAKAFKESQTEQ